MKLTTVTELATKLKERRFKMSSTIKVVKLGWFQNGSFCIHVGNHNDQVCYWLVDCPAMREARDSSISSSARDPWIFPSRKSAQDAAQKEARKSGSGARY
jgi:hypothetical protein